jgi:hypothetical protein
MRRTPTLPLAALLAALALPAAADTGYTIGPTACHRQHGFRPVDHAAEPFPPAGNGPLDIIAWRARYGFSAPGLDPLPIGSEPCHQCCESHWRNAAEVVTWCEQRKAADPSWPHDCRSPTKREQYDWSFGHQAVATPRPDDRCPGGLWHECPPPRLPCDEYFPPSASRPYCYTLAGSAQRLRCSDVPACRPGGQPQPEPPEPEPEPPVEPEPEPGGEPPAVCTLVAQLALERGCGALAPLPPCAGEWVFTCEVAP